MPLKGQHILLVEDNFLIALDIERVICAHGGEVAARAVTLADAMKRAGNPGLTSAILETRLGTEDALPIAERLSGNGVPFVFYTGCIFEEIAAAWPDAPIVPKPASDASLVNALTSLVSPQISN